MGVRGGGVSSLFSHDVVSVKAKHRDKRNAQQKGGDRTAQNGAARVTDWEQESETSDGGDNKGDCATADSTGYWEQKRSWTKCQGAMRTHGLAFLGRVFLHLTLVFKAQC